MASPKRHEREETRARRNASALAKANARNGECPEKKTSGKAKSAKEDWRVGTLPFPQRVLQSRQLLGAAHAGATVHEVLPLKKQDGS